MMTLAQEMDPIKKTLSVPLSPEAAFDLFLSDIGTWWPVASHSVAGAASKVRIEPGKGGRIYEIGPDGKEHVWGTFLGWEDGRFAAFTWHPGRSDDMATVVTVIFETSADGCTLTLTHGGFEILGETADAVSQSYLKGWDLVLGCYAAAARTPVTA